MYIEDKFIEGLVRKSQRLSKDVIRQAQKCLLDYCGVVKGGKRLLLEKYPELMDATHNDAFLNGFASHILELDDGHRYGMIHLGASIQSALLTIANREQLSSIQLLRGIVLGYEASVRCAQAIQPGHKIRGYHASGTCGTIGSAMGIAFALGFNEKQLKSTLACAVTSAAGILEIQEQSSELKPFNVGRAAMDGIIATQVGRLELSGPDDILGGKSGFLTALTDSPHPEYLTDFSDDDYAISGIYQKVHAACRHCHSAIDATLELRNSAHFSPEQVERIEVHTYRLAVESHDHTDIKGISSAKLSTPYSVALAFVKGSAGYADYNNENLSDIMIRSITRKVRVIEDEELTQKSPSILGARVIFYLKDGGVFKASCLYPKGEPENPLSHQELEEKFRELAMYGGLTSNECDEVINEIWKDSFNLNKILKMF